MTFEFDDDDLQGVEEAQKPHMTCKNGLRRILEGSRNHQEASRGLAAVGAELSCWTREVRAAEIGEHEVVISTPR